MSKTISEGWDNICKLKNITGQIVTDKVEILKIVQKFYAMLYKNNNYIESNPSSPRI